MQSSGTLVLSVDVLCEADSGSLRSLAALFERHRLPVTWAFEAPANGFAAELAGSALGHEVALLVVGAGQGGARVQPGRQVAQQLSHARRYGLTIETLALQRPLTAELARVAQQQGIRFVRSASLRRAAVPKALGIWQQLLRPRLGSRLQAPRLLPLRTVGCGLMDLPAALYINALATRDLSQADRAVREAAGGKLLHLVLEATALRSASRRDLRRLAEMLGNIDRERSRGAFSVSTLAAAAQMRAPNRSPACSILRRVA
jgi:hypothetical protein